MKKSVKFYVFGIVISVISLCISLLIINKISPELVQDQKRFTLLTSSSTNINFTNSIKDSKEHNILLYSNFYGGAGVGVGDFNNDGLQDLYFAGNLVPDKLYLNQGNLTFKDITRTAGIINDGGWSTGVTVADVNNSNNARSALHLVGCICISTCCE